MAFNFFKKFLVSICFVIISSLNCNAIVSDESLEKISQEFEQILEESRQKLNVQGCTAVIARKDKIVKIICCGTTDINNPKKITPKTMFPLSSLTKNITAMLVAALVDDGVLSFDDKVRKYLPAFFIGNEDISQKFTIRDLISHRSGFHHFLGNSLWHCGYTYEQMINSLKYINNVSGFRKKYGYQNIIFGIIGDVVEAATGKTFDELVHKYLFSKMELRDTSTRPLYIEASWFEQVKYNFKEYGLLHTLKNLFTVKTHSTATNHIIFKGKRLACQPNDYFQRVMATSGVSMSGEDFGSWLRLLLGRGSFNGDCIVSEKNYTELISNHVNITGLKEDNQVFPIDRLRNPYYGMGFFGAEYVDNDATNGSPVFFHMGGVCGACTFFAFSPNDDISVGVLANTGGTDKTIFSELMVWEFLDRVYGYKKINWIQTELDFKKKIAAEKTKNMEELESSNPGPHAKLTEYVGIYTNKIYGDIKVSTKNDTIIIDNGIKKAVLKHLNRDIFVLNGFDFCDDIFDRDEIVSFYRNEKGIFDRMYISCLSENKAVFEKKQF